MERLLRVKHIHTLQPSSQPPRWEGNLHGTNPVPHSGRLGASAMAESLLVGAGCLCLPPSSKPSPIHLPWGFPGWPHRSHDITCLLRIALQSVSQDGRVWLQRHPSKGCGVPHPRCPLPKSCFSAAKETLPCSPPRTCTCSPGLL